MREIIEKDKDFVTGIEKYSTKKKPLSNVRGKVSVSLYDENNNKIREINTENLIMDWYKEDAYERTFVNTLAQGIGYSSNAGFFLEPTKYMILSNRDKEVNSYDCFGFGDVIGYAQKRKAYSGSSSQQGSYNISESYKTTDENGNIVVHEVYDFPTNACNGTIKSILWAPVTNEYESIYISRISINSINTNTTQSIAQTVFIEDNFAYCCYLNSSYELCKFEDGKVSKISSALLAPDGTSMNTTNKVIHIDMSDTSNIKGAIVNTSTSSQVSGINANSVAVCKWNAGTGEATVEKTLLNPTFQTEPTTKKTYNIKGILRKGNYLYYALEISKYHSVAKVDMNGSLISQIHLGDSGNSWDWWSGLNIIGDNIILSTYNKTFILSDNLETLYTKNTYTSSTDFWNPATSPKFDNVYVGFEYFSGVYKIDFKGFKCPMTTCVKLPNPITKTNTNTMKVQYDFVLEPPRYKHIVAGGKQNV